MRGHVRRSMQLKSRRGFLRLSIGAGAAGLVSHAGPAGEPRPANAADTATGDPGPRIDPALEADARPAHPPGEA